MPALIAAVTLMYVWFAPPSVESCLREARRAIAQGDDSAAEAWSRKVLSRDPSNSAAAWIAGRACLQAKRESESLAYFQKIPGNAPEALEARLAAGELLLMHLHRLGETEAEFRQSHQLDPESLPANDGLSFALGMSARVWEAIPYRLKLIRLNQHRRYHLYLLCTGDTTLENDDQFKRCLAAVPDDPRARLGQARLLLDRQKYAEADALLESLVRENPVDAEAQSRRGRRLAEC